MNDHPIFDSQIDINKLGKIKKNLWK